MVRSLAKCETCGHFLPLARTGRPKRYCDGRCRVAAFRRRKREAALMPTTLHEAFGTEPANGSHVA